MRIRWRRLWVRLRLRLKLIRRVTGSVLLVAALRLGRCSMMIKFCNLLYSELHVISCDPLAAEMLAVVSP